MVLRGPLHSLAKSVTLSSRQQAPGGAAVMDALSSSDILLFGPFRFDRRGGLLLRRTEGDRYLPVSIGSRAIAVLGALTERPGDLVSKDEIMQCRLARHGGRGRQPHGADLDAASHPRCWFGDGQLYPDRVREGLPVCPSGDARADVPDRHGLIRSHLSVTRQLPDSRIRSWHWLAARLGRCRDHRIDDDRHVARRLAGE